MGAELHRHRSGLHHGRDCSYSEIQHLSRVPRLFAVGCSLHDSSHECAREPLLWKVRLATRSPGRARLPASALLLYAGVLPPVLSATAGLATVVRVALTAVLTAPLGFLMGIPFPSSIRRAGSESPQIVPWAWAANGGASVFGSSLTVLISMSYGFTASFVGGGIAYAIALVIASALSRTGKGAQQNDVAPVLGRDARTTWRSNLLSGRSFCSKASSLGASVPTIRPTSSRRPVSCHPRFYQRFWLRPAPDQWRLAEVSIPWK